MNEFFKGKWRPRMDSLGREWILIGSSQISEASDRKILNQLRKSGFINSDNCSNKIEHN